MLLLTLYRTSGKNGHEGRPWDFNQDDKPWNFILDVSLIWDIPLTQAVILLWCHKTIIFSTTPVPLFLLDLPLNKNPCSVPTLRMITQACQIICHISLNPKLLQCQVLDQERHTTTGTNFMYLRKCGAIHPLPTHLRVLVPVDCGFKTFTFIGIFFILPWK
jgi:hypothetical protein